MKRVILSLAAASLMTTTGLMAETAKAPEVKKDGVDFYTDMRTRQEVVSVDNVSNMAVSVRDRIGVTGHYGMFGMKLEGSFNTNLTTTAYDEDIYRMSQALLCINVADTKIKTGRQAITIDNHRFIGHVGWRQTYQTFDAVTFDSKIVKGMQIQGGYIWNRTGINAKFTQDLGSATYGQLTDGYLNVGLDISETMKVSVYDYYIKGRNSTGAKITGTVKGHVYNAEGAIQLGDDSTIGYYGQADFGSGKKANFVHSLAVEAQTQNFATPYATLHKFQGFSDVLAANVANGNLTVIDTAVTVGYKNDKIGKFVFIPHYIVLGSSNPSAVELDAVYTRKVTGVKGLSFLVKYAKYIPMDTTVSSSEKVMIDFSYKFGTKL